MAGIALHDGQWIGITPADPLDLADIVLMLQVLADMAGVLSTPTPDRAACDRLARLMTPYVTGVTVEQLGAAFEVEPPDVIRVLRRVLLFVPDMLQGLIP